MLLHAPDHLDTIIENISPELFVEGPLKQLYLFIDECFQSGEDVSFNYLMLNVEDPAIKNVLVYLDEEWHQILDSGVDNQFHTIEKIVHEVLEVFRGLEMETGKRQKLSELQQKQLDEKEELTALEELLEQTRQRQGL